MVQQPILWKKRILVPFWCVRIGIMLLMIAAFSLSLSTIDEYTDLVKPDITAIVVFLLLVIIVLLLDALAILLFLRDALKPGTFLIMNCFQTTIWTGLLVWDLVSMKKEGGFDKAAVGFSVFLFLTFWGLFIYAIVGYIRERKAGRRGNYTPALNPAAVDSSVYPQYPTPPHYQQNTSYSSQTGAPVELQNQQYLPPYQAGAADEFYQKQPTKPANMV